jgi:hypothetical protein
MLTFEVLGKDGSPHGKTVTYPSPSGLTTVTLRTTAVAVFGTPAKPLMRTGLYEPVAALTESRVSKTRVGETPRNADAPTGAAETDCDPIVDPTKNVDERSKPTTKCRLNDVIKRVRRGGDFFIELANHRTTTGATTIFELDLICLSQ